MLFRSLFYESDGGKVVEFTGKIVRSLFNDSRKNFVYGCLLSDPIGIMRKFVNAQQQKQLSEKNTIPKKG